MKRFSFKTKNITSYALLWLSFLVILIPFYWVIISSVKSNYEIGLSPPTFFPKEWHFSNYSKAWLQENIDVAFMNSLSVSLVVTLGILVLSTLTAYVLAKGKIVGAKIIFMAIVATIIVPPTVIMIPLFFIITKLGLYDSLWAIIIPFCVTSFGIFFLKQYLEDLPDELLEAARLDGLNEWKILFYIVVPSIKPALITLASIEFVNNWNSFVMPLVLIKSTDKFTIPLKLGTLITGTDVPSFSLLLAINVISILPVVVLFLLLNRYIISGVLDGAVKG